MWSCGSSPSSHLFYRQHVRLAGREWKVRPCEDILGLPSFDPHSSTPASSHNRTALYQEFLLRSININCVVSFFHREYSKLNHSRFIKRTPMTKSKKSQLQRQAFEKVQARAAATIPIHRESIVNLRGSVVPSTTGTMADVTNMVAGAQADNSDRRRMSHQYNHRDPGPLDKEWETKFCVEPPGDCSTCMLGTFVPCALYGKVNWRFTQRANGKGASQDDWESRNGCNGLCWAYFGASLFTHGILSG